MTTPSNTIRALDPYWQAIREGACRAERNLEELTPCTTHVGRDEAVIDRAALKRCVDLIANEIQRLNRLIAKYDYPTSGEHVQGDERIGLERWTNTHADDGCRSCAQSVIWTPIHQAGLCAWCFAFWRAEGFEPTPALVQLHDQGRKITTPIVDRELKPLREERRRLAAATGKSRRKRNAKKTETT